MKNKQAKRLMSKSDISKRSLEMLSDSDLCDISSSKCGYTESTKLRARRVLDNRQFNSQVY